MGHRMLPIAFSLTDPRCHANEIWDKIGYNSVTVVIGLATVRQNLKLQKVILFSSTLTHSQCDAGNIAFCNFLLFSMCKSLNVAVNKCIN